MSEPIKKPEQQPESYRPGEKPEIINMAEEKAENAYKVYKNILYYVNVVELPETIKVACLKGRGFAFDEFEEKYKPLLSDRYTHYYSTGFATDYFGEMTYVVGCLVDVLDNLPEGINAMDTGIKHFIDFSFRADSIPELVGGPDGPGEGMKTASEYIDTYVIPEFTKKIVNIPNPGIYEIKKGEHIYQLGTFEVYKNMSDINPEMSIYIPLK